MMSAISPSPAVLTLEDFLVKYPKLKPGFEVDNPRHTFVGRETFVGEPEFVGASESKEEFTSPLKLLGVLKTIEAHMHKRWPSPDGRKNFSLEELVCLEELVSISDINAYLPNGKEMAKSSQYFEALPVYGLDNSEDFQRLRTLHVKLIASFDFKKIRDAEDLSETLSSPFLLLQHGKTIFDMNRHFYERSSAFIQLKIAAKLAYWYNDLGLQLISRINFNESMPSLVDRDITDVLDHLRIRHQPERKQYKFTFRLNEIGGVNKWDESFPPQELSFFALRLPVLGSVAAEAVEQFSSHKKSICEKIMAIPKLSIRIQILHALLHEKG